MTNKHTATTNTKRAVPLAPKGSSSSTSSDHPCEEKILIIQVMGKNHSTDQQIIILDDKNQELSSTATQVKAKGGKGAPLKEKIEIIDNDRNRLTSTLHIWDWSKQSSQRRKLALKIKKSLGGFIILPYTEEFISSTDRKDDEQQNQIVPLIPFSLIKNTKRHDLGVPVLTKPGYLYIYKDNQLWREIKITQDRTGKTLYSDIDLSDCQQNGKFTKDSRPAVGVELADIWLPRKYQGVDKRYTNRLSLSVKYSEVQLSAARLNYLQSKPAEAVKTPLFHDLALSQAFLKEKFARISKADELQKQLAQSLEYPLDLRLQVDAYTTGLFPIKERFNSLRARDENLECYFDNPASYLYDTTTQFFTDSIKQAKQTITIAESGKKIQLTRLELGALQTELAGKVIIDRKTLTIPEKINALLGIDLSILTPQGLRCETPTESLSLEQEIADYFGKKLTAIQKQYISELKDNAQSKVFWLGTAGQNILAPYQEQQIYGFIVEDHRYPIRHLTSRLTASQLLMQAAIERSGQYPHSDSALLLQHIMAPLNINGKPNQLRNALLKLNEAGYQEIAKQSGVLYRQAIRQHYQELQATLAIRLNQTEQAYTWADHLSQAGLDQYTASYAALALNMSMLATAPSSLDPLYAQGVEISHQYASAGFSQEPTAISFYLSCAIGTTAVGKLYHSYLWRNITDEDSLLKEPYQLPAIIADNQGTGTFRADVLATASYNGLEITADSLTRDTLLLIPPEQTNPLGSLLKLTADELNNLLSSVATALSNSVAEAREQLNSHISELAEVKATHQTERTKTQQQQAEAKAKAQAARQKLIGVTAIKPITFYGLAADQIQVQNIDLTRTLTAGTPFREVSIASIVRHYSSEGTATTATQPGQYDQPSHNGQVVKINGQPANQINKQVLLFSSEGANLSEQATPVTLLDNDNHPIAQGTRTVETPKGQANTNVQTRFLGIIYPTRGQLSQLITADNQARQAALQAVENSRKLRLAHANTYRLLLRERNIYQQTYRQRVNNSAHRFFQSAAFAQGLLIYKTWGFYNELDSYAQNIQTEGRARTIAGVVASTTDFAFAAEEVVYRTLYRAKVDSLPSLLRLSVDELRNKGIYWLGSDTLSSAGLGRFSYLAIGQAAFATIGAGVALYDYIKSIDRHENAASQLGKGMAFAGTTLGIFASFSASTFLFFGVLGWAALILIAAGLLIVYYNQTTPLETWLANGPFGHNQSQDYQHLQGNQAFYRLVNLFVQINITFSRPTRFGLANVDGQVIKMQSRHPKFNQIIENTNLYITVSSNIDGLVGGEMAVPEVYLASKTKHLNIRRILLAKENSGSAVTYYLNYPYQQLGEKPYDNLAVRAQFKSPQNGLLMVFHGADDLLDNNPYNPVKDNQPNFNKINRLFWADEQTNRTATARPGELIGSDIL